MRSTAKHKIQFWKLIQTLGLQLLWMAIFIILIPFQLILILGEGGILTKTQKNLAHLYEKNGILFIIIIVLYNILEFKRFRSEGKEVEANTQKTAGFIYLAIALSLITFHYL